ncbi:MAG: hypothetical protein HOK20_04120 [Alphaproteobacteria bacterium]|nr:hypothetical protein [Alphaproteobacteria bacterium]MBT5540760.1 hypothetical protein [Alphaproteobacteria bacterium]
MIINFKGGFVSILLSFVLATGVALAEDPTVSIVDVGQGSCNIVRYHNRVLFHDAGSNERKISHASELYFHEKDLLEDKGTYQLSRGEQGALSTKKDSEGVDAHKEGTSDRGRSDSKDSADSYDSEGEKGKDRDLDAATEAIIGRIHNIIDGVEHITIVVSHADSDHYSLLHQIFTEESDLKGKIKHIVLGGFRDSYIRTSGRKSTFQEWLQKMEVLDKVVYSGYRDGFLSEGNNDCHNSLVIAPPYPDERLVSKPLAVDIIENSLKIADDKSSPLATVLSMNAGHKMIDLDRSIVVNPSGNMNSIVVKVGTDVKSVLFTGDVNAAGWDHMRASWLADELKSNVLVLSHHGGVSSDYRSDSYGATSRSSLQLVDPSTILVSSGYFLGYKHPTEEATSLVKDHLLGKQLRTGKHYVHYFSSSNSNFYRKLIDVPFFSTFSSGDISFELMKYEEFEFTASRGRSPVLESIENGSLFEKTSKGYIDKKVVSEKYPNHKIYFWKYDEKERSKIVPADDGDPITTGKRTEEVHFLHIVPQEGPELYRLLLKTSKDEEGVL